MLGGFSTLRGKYLHSLHTLEGKSSCRFHFLRPAYSKLANIGFEKTKLLKSKLVVANIPVSCWKPGHFKWMARLQQIQRSKFFGLAMWLFPGVHFWFHFPAAVAALKTSFPVNSTVTSWPWPMSLSHSVLKPWPGSHVLFLRKTYDPYTHTHTLISQRPSYPRRADNVDDFTLTDLGDQHLLLSLYLLLLSCSHFLELREGQLHTGNLHTWEHAQKLHILMQHVHRKSLCFTHVLHYA